VTGDWRLKADGWRLTIAQILSHNPLGDGTPASRENLGQLLSGEQWLLRSLNLSRCLLGKQTCTTFAAALPKGASALQVLDVRVNTRFSECVGILREIWDGCLKPKDGLLT